MRPTARIEPRREPLNIARFAMLSVALGVVIGTAGSTPRQVLAQPAEPGATETPPGEPPLEQAPAPEAPAAENPSASEPITPAPEPPAEAPGETSAIEAPAPEAAAPSASGANTAGEDSGAIVVTAQRYEQSLKNTPVAVDVFTPEAMDRRSVTNLQSIGNFTPNLELHSTNRPGGGGSAYAAYIRGIGTGDFQFPTDPGVGLYIDDVYMGRTSGGLLSIDTDIERVEVIKGPQGTLFGRNTIGGAFNVITMRPETTGTPTTIALVRLGSYGRKDFAVSVNGPLVQDKLGAKIAVASLHSDGYGERVLTGEKTDDEERFVGRAGLRLTVIDDVDIRVNGDYSKQDQTPPNGRFLRFAPMIAPPTMGKIARFNMFAAPVVNPGLNLPAGSVYDTTWLSPSAHDNYALQPAFDRYEMGGGSASVSYVPLAEFGIKSISAVRAMNVDVAVDGDQTPYSLQTSHTKLDQHQLSEELQFSGLIAQDLLRYMVGLYVFREVGDSTVLQQSFSPLFETEPAPMSTDPMIMMMMAMAHAADAADQRQRFELTSTSYAAFTQETLQILPSLHLTAGARINRDDKVYGYSLVRPQTGMVAVPFGTSTGVWTSFTPKGVLDWKPIEPLMLYASVAQGFKSGGFGPSTSASLPRPKYDPETVTAYEIGIKSEWLNRRLSAMLAGFYNDYRDIQLTVQAVDPVTNANVRTTQNAGSSKIKGFEVELGAMPFDGLRLEAGVGYVDAKFDTLTPQAVMSGFKVGDRLPQIPDWSISGGAQYSFDPGIGSFTLRADVTYKGNQFLTGADPSSFQAAYALYNARVAYVPKGVEALELSLQGLNLTDQVYYVYHATLAPTGQEVAIAAAPRLFYFMAKYTYD